MKEFLNLRIKPFRTLVLTLHRYLGFAIGVLLTIVGLTGSLLVFYPEIDHALIENQVGAIVPQADVLPVSVLIDRVKTLYGNQPDFQVNYLMTREVPYIAWVQWQDNPSTEVFINPYTGAILGSRVHETSFFGRLFALHYQLLAGQVGMTIIGIVAFLFVILSLTGIALWPGWRKFWLGFKIKWNAHPQRKNFDIHKVAGIATAFFFLLTAGTGFVWNFYDHAKPILYAATLTPKPSEPVSKPIANQTPLNIDGLLNKADAVMPEAMTTMLYFPQKPEEVLQVRKRQPQENTRFGLTFISLDQYSGEVVQVQDALKPNAADRFLNSFQPLHFGTFGGLPTRILYIFVGLAPLILFITGSVMWWHRKKGNRSKKGNRNVMG
jgi:uncharacterized iron-regulated membrane protein